MALNVLWVSLGGGEQASMPSPNILALVGKRRPDVLVLETTYLDDVALLISTEARRHAPQLNVVMLYHSVTDGAAGPQTIANDGQALHASVPARQLASAVRGEPEEPSVPAEVPTTTLPHAIVSLTAREREILPLTAAGLTSTAIGRRLFISSRTVERHRANIMRKLGVGNRTELLCLALRHGIVELGEHDLIVRERVEE